MLARDGGMNVPNIRQDPGSVTALPRAVADGATDAGLRAESALRGRSSAHSAPSTVSFTRLAWFDVNGDGHIDPRSMAAGGDATLLVPADAVDLPTYSRTITPVAGTHSAKAAPEDRAAAPGNPAQTNRAVDSYQRYGQTPAPSDPVATAAAAPAPPAIPAAPIPAPAAPAATPATPVFAVA
jgi:hypothetical protein